MHTSEGLAADPLAAILDHDVLHDQGEAHHQEEQGAVEKAREHVQLCWQGWENERTNASGAW